MRQEFFGINLEEALEKASARFKIPVEKISYILLAEEFGKPLKPKKRAIIVEADDQPVQPVTESPDRAQEASVREQGEIPWAIFFVDGIFKRMGLSTKTTAMEKGEDIILQVQVLSGELDLRRGESRELRGAIQHLVNRTVTNQGENSKRFILDIGGNLEERSRLMNSMAMGISEKVLAIKKTVHIHLMDSQDRRILHVNLLGNKRIRTQSLGDKQFRILSVIPNEDPEKSKNNPNDIGKVG